MIKKKYTEQENEFIKNNRHLTIEEMAQCLNRTPDSVRAHNRHFGYLYKRKIKTPLCGLTPAEKRVMALLARGHTKKEITEILHIEMSTLRTHLINIYDKYDIRGACSLVRAVLKYLKEERLLNAEFIQNGAMD